MIYSIEYRYNDEMRTKCFRVDANGDLVPSECMKIEIDDPVTGKSDSGNSGIRGLGDVVSAVTKSLGIKECGGCAKRREALNKLVPFKNENPGAPAQHPAGDAPGEKSDG